MTQNDINRIFTEKVTELIAQGFQINPATMGGSQGEIGKVDLRKGSDIIRVLLTADSGYGESPDYISLIVGNATNAIRFDRFDTLGNTIWYNELKIISKIKFAKIADNYFTDMKSGRQIQKKRYLRWKQKERENRKELPDSFKSVALRYVQRQPGMKTCKLSDIERVTRVNCYEWGKVLPNLKGYEIKAKGKTFLIKAPSGDR